MPADPTNAALLEDFRPIGDVLPVETIDSLETAADFRNFLSASTTDQPNPESQLIIEEEHKGEA